MSELLLEALMQLFALLTNYNREKETGNGKDFIFDYLERQYNASFASKYIEVYETYLNKYGGSDFIENKEEVNDEHREQIISICEKLNLELEKTPKTLLFIQLLKFLKRGGHIGDTENNMINILAKELNIDSSDYKNLKTFILNEPEDVEDKSTLLLISGEKPEKGFKIKHIYNPKQQTKVWILHLGSIDSYIFKYSGKRNLYLNGYKVEQNNIYVFAPGSVIKTSLMPPVYYGTVAEMFMERSNKTRIVYKAVDVEYRFNPKLIAVHKFSLLGHSGELIGIIGGSGTGKSTLINVLNGNHKLSAGKITINGHDLDKDKEQLEGVIGYVPQDDMLIEELTVYENLYYNARLCFSKLSDSKISDLVNRAISDFDLREAKDLVVGSPLNKTLSGGQRKRLNIALELIRQPSILFVDEPTSGLSSLDSEKVMSLLKRQTLQGRLVIMIIHQPSSDIYKLFDRMLILDKGGRVIHNGNPMDAIVYFKKMANFVNPEERECQTCGNVKTELPLRIIEARKVTPEGRLIRSRRISPEKWYKFYLKNFESKYKWKKSINKDKPQKLPPNLFSIPSVWEQLKIYLSRDALSKLKDKQYLLINFLEAPVLAVILGFFTKYINTNSSTGGYVFADNINLPAYLFMSVVVSLFMGLNVSAEEIVKDRKLLQRESFLNLSRFSYLSAKIIILLIISAIQTLSFVVVGNSILEIHGLTFEYWAILFSLAAFSNMLGLNLSSGLKSVVSIYISIPLILVPQMLFSGVIVQFDELHPSISNNEFVPPIGDVMPSRWGYEALAVTQFKSNAYEKYYFNVEQQMSDVSYCSNLLLPELKMRNNEVKYLLQKGDSTNAQYNLNVLNHHIKEVNNKIIIDVTGNMNSNFNVKNYSDSTHDFINNRLNSLISNYRNDYIHLNSKKDSISMALLNKYGSADALLEFKHNYYNNKLAAWLLNKHSLNQILFTGEKYIRKKQPVFQIPYHPYGRAQFYAPYKRIGKMLIPTVVFNIIILWLMTVVMFFTLYFQIINRAIIYFEHFKLRKLYKRLQKLNT